MSAKVGSSLAYVRANSIHDLGASAGKLLVVGDCDGLYVGQSDGVWTPIETSAGVGVPVVRIDGRPEIGSEGIKLASVADLAIFLVSVDDRTVRVDISRGTHLEQGTPFKVQSGPIELAIDLDANLPTVQVRHGDDNIALLSGPPPNGPFVLAESTQGVTISEVASPTPLCDALTNR